MEIFGLIVFVYIVGAVISLVTQIYQSPINWFKILFWPVVLLNRLLSDMKKWQGDKDQKNY